MLLVEIMDDYKRIPIVTIKKPIDTSQAGRNQSVSKLGSGIQGAAYGFKSRPNAVTKLANMESLNDSYLNYIQTILQHQDNPFFPKIHNAKILEYTQSRWDPRIHDEDLDDRDREEMRRPRYTLALQMEKLQPLGNTNLRDSAAQVLQSLGLEEDDFNVDNWDDPKNKDNMWDEVMRTNFGDAGFRKQLASKTKNPKFKEALQIMEPVFQKYGSDLKEDNMMARLTQYGPQIVFVDPAYPNSFL